MNYSIDPLLLKAFHHLKEAGPFSNAVKVVVGPQGKKEHVKNIFLATQSSAMVGAWCVTLGELAFELLKGKKTFIPKVIERASQKDALLMILKKGDENLRQRFFQSREYAGKIAHLLTEIDLHALHEEERRALLESFSEHDESLAPLLQTVSALWDEEQLEPWSPAYHYRKTLTEFQEEEIPAQIYLFGFNELKPLEKSFVEFLKDRTQVHEAGPVDFKENIKYWRAHSVFDESYLLAEDLLKKPERNYKQVVIRVPEGSILFQKVATTLIEKGIPLQNKNVNFFQNEPASWWLGVLQALKGGMTLDLVSPFFKDRSKTGIFLEHCFKKGIHRLDHGIKKIAKDLDFEEPLLFVDLAKIWFRNLTLEDFRKTLSVLEELLKNRKMEVPIEPLFEFIDDLQTSREYLLTFKGRIGVFCSLYEEWLEYQCRKNIPVNPEGVWLVNHEQWLPFQPEKQYFLSAQDLGRTAKSDLFSEWKAVSALWGRLAGENKKKPEVDYAAVLAASKENIFSSAHYNIQGHESIPTQAYLKFIEEDESEKEITAADAGWFHLVSFPKKTPIVQWNETQEKSLRISAFDDYLKCPFVFYGRHLLTLKEDEELSIEPWNLAKGRVLHKILETVLKENLIYDNPLSDIEADVKIKETIKKFMEGQPLEGMYRDGALQKKWKESYLKWIHQWVAYERKRKNDLPGLKPWKLEHSLKIELVPGITLTGRLDRVDSDGAGFVIIDYKTGSNALTGGEILKGYGSQMALYAMALQEETKLSSEGFLYIEVGKKFSATKGVFPASGLKRYHNAKPQNSGFLKSDLAESLDSLKIYFQQKLAELFAGNFTPAPAQPKNCITCAFRYTCGYKVDEHED